MKRTFVLKIQKVPLDGEVAMRVEKPIEDFYNAAGAVLQISPATLMRPALREHRKKVLRQHPDLKKQLQRISPQVLNGI